MIIIYHSVFPDSGPSERWGAGRTMTLSVFKRHIMWLADHYRIVSLTEYLAGHLKNNISKRRYIAITFDDGFRITYQCVSSFLNENNISATFFVTTGHLNHGELLWFSYLNALCFEKLYKTVEVNQHIMPLKTLAECRKAWHVLTMLAKSMGTQ